ncbi:uncharacterized protein H6S33_008100 [Morchella sextelata]|uniref:uncharacterized protein n=1 Tax=Morchella sextelata TaxID=1174677 RepID=UPI001D04D9BF|nr:uncharacterized protein H6S33_008100 [Morchella sextelata]KAH0603096.1 hypothetical protein H6S33_008100 [Morchella sextelata]
MKRHASRSPPDPPRRSTRIKRVPPAGPISIAIPAPPRPPPIPRPIITHIPTANTSSTPNPTDPNAPPTTNPQTYYLPATEKSDLYTYFRADYARTGYRPTLPQLAAWFAYTHSGRRLPLPVIAAVVNGGGVVGRSAKVGQNMAARIRDWALARKEVTGCVPGVGECMLWMQRVGMEMRGDVDVGEVLGGVVDEEEEDEEEEEGGGGGEGWVVLDGLVVDGGVGERRGQRRKPWESVEAQEEVCEEVEWKSCLSQPAAKCARHEANMKAQGLENTTGTTGGWRDSERGESWDANEDTTDESEESRDESDSEESSSESEQIRSSRRNTRFSSKQTAALSKSSSPSTRCRTSSTPRRTTISRSITASSPLRRSSRSASKTTSSPLRRTTRSRSNTASNPPTKPTRGKPCPKPKSEPTPSTRSTTSISHTPSLKPSAKPGPKPKPKPPPSNTRSTKSKSLEPTGRYTLRSGRSETFVSKSDDESGDENSEHDADDEDEDESEGEESEEESKESELESDGSMEETIVCAPPPSLVPGLRKEDLASEDDESEDEEDRSEDEEDSSANKEGTSEDESEEPEVPTAELPSIPAREEIHDNDEDNYMDELSSPLFEASHSQEQPYVSTPDVVLNKPGEAEEVVKAVSSPPSEPTLSGERSYVDEPEDHSNTLETFETVAAGYNPLLESDMEAESSSGAAVPTSTSKPIQEVDGGEHAVETTARELLSPDVQPFIAETRYTSPALDEEGDTTITGSQPAPTSVGRDGENYRIVLDSEADTSDIDMVMDLDRDSNDDPPTAPESVSVSEPTTRSASHHRTPTTPMDFVSSLDTLTAPSLPPHRIVQDLNRRADMLHQRPSSSAVDMPKMPVYQMLRQRQQPYEEAQQRDTLERRRQKERVSEEARAMLEEYRELCGRVPEDEGGIMTTDKQVPQLEAVAGRDVIDLQSGPRELVIPSSSNIQQAPVTAGTAAALQTENTHLTPHTPRAVQEQTSLQPATNTEDDESQDQTPFRNYDDEDEWSSLGDTTVSEGGWSVSDNSRFAPIIYDTTTTETKHSRLSQAHTTTAADDDNDDDTDTDWDMHGDTTVSEGGWSAAAPPEEEATVVVRRCHGRVVIAAGDGVAVEEGIVEDLEAEIASGLYEYREGSDDTEIPEREQHAVTEDNRMVVYARHTNDLDGNGGVDRENSETVSKGSRATAGDGEEEQHEEDELFFSYGPRAGDDGEEGDCDAVLTDAGECVVRRRGGRVEITAGGDIPVDAGNDGNSVSAEVMELFETGNQMPALVGMENYLSADEVTSEEEDVLGVCVAGERESSGVKIPIQKSDTSVKPAEDISNENNDDTTATGAHHTVHELVDTISEDERSIIIDLSDYMRPSQEAEALSPALSGIDLNAAEEDVDDTITVPLTQEGEDAARRRPQGFESSIHADVQRYLETFDPTVSLDLERGGLGLSVGEGAVPDGSGVDTAESPDEDEEEEEEGEIPQRPRGRKRKRVVLSSSDSENSDSLNPPRKANAAFAPESNSEATSLPNLTWNRTTNRPHNPFQSRTTNTNTLRYLRRSLPASVLPRPRTPTTASITHAATLLAFSPLHTDFRDTPPPPSACTVVTEEVIREQTPVPDVVASVGRCTSDGRYSNGTSPKLRRTPAYGRSPPADTGVGLDRRLWAWYESVVGAGAGTGERGVTQRALEGKVAELVGGRLLPEGWLADWKERCGVTAAVGVKGCLPEDPICLDDDEDE